MLPARQHRQTASSLVEYVLVGALAATLMAALTGPLRSHGGSVGVAAGARIHAAVSQSPGAKHEEAAQTPQLRNRSAGGAASAAHVGRAQGGTTPTKVPVSDLRVGTDLPALAAWRESGHAAGATGGIEWSIAGSACALCIGTGFEHAVTAGRTTERAGTGGSGLHADASGSVHAAVAAADARVSAQRVIGRAVVEVDGAARAVVGGDAEAVGEVHLTRGEQSIELRGEAMAGGVARATGSVGVSLLGIAIEQSGSAEGWAGAGLRGAFGIKRTSTGFAWNVGWGAALGIGGGANWSGRISFDPDH